MRPAQLAVAGVGLINVLTQMDVDDGSRQLPALGDIVVKSRNRH